jgi:hypothetical protein
VRCRGQLRLRVAAPHALAGQHETLRGERGSDIEQRRQRRDLELRRSAALRAARIEIGGHGKNRLAGILHQAVGKNRIVVYRAAVIVLARNIRGQRHGRDTGRGERPRTDPGR